MRNKCKQSKVNESALAALDVLVLLNGCVVGTLTNTKFGENLPVLQSPRLQCRGDRRIAALAGAQTFAAESQT